jgi:hypothetical protein
MKEKQSDIFTIPTAYSTTAQGTMLYASTKIVTPHGSTSFSVTTDQLVPRIFEAITKELN